MTTRCQLGRLFFPVPFVCVSAGEPSAITLHLVKDQPIVSECVDVKSELRYGIVDLTVFRGSAIARIVGRTTKNFPDDFNSTVRMWVSGPFSVETFNFVYHG